MDFKKVVIIGGGVLGSQIAYQSAYCGFDVTIWLRSEGSITRTQPKIDRLHGTYAEALRIMNTPEGKSPAKWCNGLASQDSFNYEDCIKANEKAYSSLKLELDLDKALDNADLVIESLAEDPKA